MNIFLDSTHELRWFWRFALYIIIFAVALVGTGIALSVIFVAARLPETDLMLLAENVVVLAVPAVFALFFMARFVEHARIAVFGVGFHEYWKKDLLLGSGISTFMLAVMLAGSAAFGQLSMRWTAQETPVSSLLLTLLLLVVAAAVEELVFRGYPMQVMMRGIGAWPAALFMSVLFGLLHMNNPNATPLGTVNTILAGLMLSIAYLKTRSLWLPYGIHVGWNVGLGMVLGYPLSGIDIGSLWTSKTTGADFIVGGNYGPEGGLVATLIFAGVTLWIRAMHAPRISPTMLGILSQAQGPDNLPAHGDAAAILADSDVNAH